jgi:hypothetical protein
MHEFSNSPSSVYYNALRPWENLYLLAVGTFSAY